MSALPFFVTPEEFDSLIEAVRVGTDLRFWRFPEAIATGPVHERADAIEQPVLLGELPRGRNVWNAREALIEGFVGLERPRAFEQERVLCEGRIYAVENHAPFKKLKRMLQKVAVNSLDVVSDVAPYARLRLGTKASNRALDLIAKDWVLRQDRHFRSHFEARTT